MILLRVDINLSLFIKIIDVTLILNIFNDKLLNIKYNTIELLDFIGLIFIFYFFSEQQICIGLIIKCASVLLFNMLYGYINYIKLLI